MNNCRLVINGKDLMDSLNANFFRNIQQYQYYNGNGMEYIKIEPYSFYTTSLTRYVANQPTSIGSFTVNISGLNSNINDNSNIIR